MSELAILGGNKIRSEPYPTWPVWDQRDIDAVTEVVRSERWGGYPYPGPKTSALAKAFSDMQGGGIAVPMANGTVTMMSSSPRIPSRRLPPPQWLPELFRSSLM
jgi:hypothetical protein